MVTRRFAVMLALFSFSMSVYSEAAVSPDQLRNRMNQSNAEQRSAAERLRLIRDNSNQVRSLDERDLFYTLPDGRRVRAILLPNGRRSPAIMDATGLKPACLTTSSMLVPGDFNPTTGVIDCAIPAAEIAFIDDELYGTKQSRMNDVKSQSERRRVEDDNEKQRAAEITKHNRATTDSRVTDSGAAEASRPKPVPVDPNIYIPPSSSEVRHAQASVFALSVERPYGVQRGVWAEVRLERPVSSADSGSVEYTLDSDLAGRFQTLPAGTVFFGTKQININNRKLESRINLAKLPDGKEIRVTGWIYSLNRTAGLSGRLERDREGENAAAAGNAALAGLGAAANSVAGPGNVAGAVVDTYTGEMVSNERRYSGQTAPAATIHVAPQRAHVQFSEPF